MMAGILGIVLGAAITGYIKITEHIKITFYKGLEGSMYSAGGEFYTYNKNKHIENYRGLFYQASRKTKINNQEPLEDSSDIKYFVLTKEINIPSNYVETKFDFSMSVEKNSYCDGISKLYFADEMGARACRYLFKYLIFLKIKETFFC